MVLVLFIGKLFSKRKKEMKDIYYVRRSEDGKATHNMNRLVTKMSTPRKIDALKSAAECSISNPGYHYYVYKENTQIAKFYVEEEN